MTIFGKPLSQYTQFCSLFLILVPLVGVVRLVLSLSGTPNASVKWISVTAAVWIGVVYNAVRVHTRGFGAYKQLLVITVLLNLAGQAVIICGIVLGMITGETNIFSAPEYSFFGNGANLLHVGAHLFIATTAGSLVAWALGSFVLFITKRVASPNPTTTAA